MREAFEVPSFTGVCATTGEVLVVGDEYVSALVPERGGYRRVDVRLCHWSGPPDGSIAFWKGRVAEVEPTPRPSEPSIDELWAAFDRLALDDGEDATIFRFLLILWLARRKALKLLRTEEEGRQRWLVFLRKTACGETEKVLDPGLTEDHLQEMEDRLVDWLRADRK